MKNLFLYTLVLMLISNSLSAQIKYQDRKSKRNEKNKRINAIIKQEEEGVIHYKTHFAGGFKLVNDGYGGFLEFAKSQSVNKALLFQFEIDEKKHSKEEKITNPYINSAPFIYGKMNFFYPLKLGVQQQFLLGNKGNRNGVSVSCNFGGGIALGILRPYLFEVLQEGDTTTAFLPSNEVFNDSTYVNQVNIIGGPGLGQGWNKMKMIPGVYLKSALRFDYGKYNEVVSALEIGASLEYYSKKIPQMIAIKQDQLFLGVYLSLIFGTRK